MKLSMESLKIRLFFSSLFSILIVSNTVDTITKTHSITGSNTIVSSGGSFEMGFFSPGSSRNQYLGIWYKNISPRTVVWVANREIPLLDTSSVLTIINPGILALVNGTGSVIWYPNTTGSTRDPVARLMETGNLVVQDANDKSGHFLWQSFDYPCDTLLPGMNLGKNFVTGLERHLSSWKSSDDPAPGEFTYRCDPQGYPQNILNSGSAEVFRTGPWNGIGFSGRPSLKSNSIYAFELVYTKEEVYYDYKLLSSVVSRFSLNHTGVVQRWNWIDRTQQWVRVLTSPTDNCDTYKLCGPNGNCIVGNNPVCSCLSKFVPHNQREWGNGDWYNGCVRRTPLDCHNGDGFVKYSGYKMPDTRNSWFDRNMTLRECEMVCLKNCSCMAYSNLDIRRGGSGCLLWFGELIDMRELNTNEQDVYIRMASSELEDSTAHSKKREIVAVTLALLIGLLLLGITLIVYLRKRKRKNSQLNREGILMHKSEQGYTDKTQKEDLELPLFDLTIIANSTNNFSINNKLGEGGFGPVYKGTLEGGQEIAVKRLSKNSSQGLDEFKNEVICIAKLQHRNLVKLLGCCIQGEEMMLIYEYMPNKSLDYFIFDQSQSTLLDWSKRFHIINGVARGLLYLHQDSRLRIIHRDLKASNILLDIDMNPKISDFGIARSFGGNEIEANTKRVIGTYGYMSPEYAIDGLFSVKSDVFSFGVLVLEIVSGKKNKGFYHPGHSHNLLGH
ncbi:G-type lectin S-receptor-like serine/threonine-protein kinase, partial [Camellia lanceoleosa]